MTELSTYLPITPPYHFDHPNKSSGLFEPARPSTLSNSCTNNNVFLDKSLHSAAFTQEAAAQQFFSLPILPNLSDLGHINGLHSTPLENDANIFVNNSQTHGQVYAENIGQISKNFAKDINLNSISNAGHRISDLLNPINNQDGIGQTFKKYDGFFPGNNKDSQASAILLRSQSYSFNAKNAPNSFKPQIFNVRKNPDMAGLQKAQAQARIQLNSNPNITTQAHAQIQAKAQAQAQQKKNNDELNHLVTLTCAIIVSTWPNHSNSQQSNLTSIRKFIQVTFKNSLFDITILKIALYYLICVKNTLNQRSKTSAADDSNDTPETSPTKRSKISSPLFNFESTRIPTTTPANLDIKLHVSNPQQKLQVKWCATGLESPISPTETLVNTPNSNSSDKHGKLSNEPKLLSRNNTLPNSTMHKKIHYNHLKRTYTEQKYPVNSHKVDVTCCGRRMFIASLILASKFHMDKTYTNRAWNKLIFLETSEINEMERAFMNLLDGRLFIRADVFKRWNKILPYLTVKNNQISVADLPPFKDFTKSLSTK